MPKPIIVEFSNESEVWEVLRQKAQLVRSAKYRKVFLEWDLPPEKRRGRRPVRAGLQGEKEEETRRKAEGTQDQRVQQVVEQATVVEARKEKDAGEVEGQAEKAADKMEAMGEGEEKKEGGDEQPRAAAEEKRVVTRGRGKTGERGRTNSG